MSFYKRVKKAGKLLLKTKGNWDYYLFNNLVFSIGKNGAGDSLFGNIEYFQKTFGIKIK